MNKLALLSSLLALALSGNALAQSQDYRLAHVSERGFSAIDVGTTQKNSESSVFATSQVFYPTTEMTQGVRVDYLIVIGEYDCTSPGRWRPMNIIAFESGVVEAQAEDEDYNAKWEQHQDGSWGYANWAGTCRGVADEYRLPFNFASAEGREQALRYYRDFLQKNL